jgi:hypothetical protein
MASLVPEAPIPIALEVQSMSLSTSELEVIQWLESIGFKRYHQNFVAAGIFSLAIVLEIESVDDLQELGIPKFPAKLLIKHILELKSNGFTAPPGESDGTCKENELLKQNEIIQAEADATAEPEEKKRLAKIKAEKVAAEAEAAAAEAKRLRQIEEEERLVKIHAENKAAAALQPKTKEFSFNDNWR